MDGRRNAKSKNYHKILIIAENNADKNHDGLIDRPDDEGQSRPAGLLKFKWKTPQTVFGMDLIDCDGSSEIASDRGYISFRNNGAQVARVGFGSFTTSSSHYYDSTVHYHDNSANHLKPITANDLRVGGFNEVYVNMGWSTAIDNIFFDSDFSTVIPEPTSIFACLPLAMMLRRRNSR